MLKKMSIRLLCLAASFSNNLYSDCAPFQPDYEVEFAINHGEFFERTNYVGPISGICTIHMNPGESTLLTATVIRPSILLAGREVKVNNHLTLTVRDGSHFKLSASFVAALRLKNESNQYDIRVTCQPDFNQTV